MKSAASGFKDSPASLEAGLDDGEDLEGTEGLLEEGDADGDGLKEDDGLEGGKGRAEGPIEGESLGDGDVLKGRGEGPIEGLDDGDGLEDWVALGDWKE